MSLNYYKSETEKICKTKGWDRAEINTVWLLLSEEFGELASAIRQSKKTFKKSNMKKDKGVDIMMEMGDVFSYLFQLAHMLNVDLDKMWIEHGKKMNRTIQSVGATGGVYKGQGRNHCSLMNCDY